MHYAWLRTKLPVGRYRSKLWHWTGSQLLPILACTLVLQPACRITPPYPAIALQANEDLGTRLPRSSGGRTNTDLYLFLQLTSAGLQSLNRLLLRGVQREIDQGVGAGGAGRRRRNHGRVGVLTGQLFCATALPEGHLCKRLTRV